MLQTFRALSNSAKVMYMHSIINEQALPEKFRSEYEALEILKEFIIYLEKSSGIELIHNKKAIDKVPVIADTTKYRGKTLDEKEEIARLLNEKLSISEVSRRTGYCRQTIRNVRDTLQRDVGIKK